MRGPDSGTIGAERDDLNRVRTQILWSGLHGSAMFKGHEWLSLNMVYALKLTTASARALGPGLKNRTSKRAGATKNV